MKYSSFLFSAIVLGLVSCSSPVFAADQNAQAPQPSSLSIFWHGITEKVSSLFSKPAAQIPKTTDTKSPEQTKSETASTSQTTPPKQPEQPKPNVEDQSLFTTNKKGQRVKLNPNKNVPPQQVKAAENWLKSIKAKNEKDIIKPKKAANKKIGL